MTLGPGSLSLTPTFIIEPLFLAAPESAAEPLQKIAQAKTGAGVAPHGKAPVIAGAAAVGGTAVLHLVQRVQVFLVLRLHGNGAANML